MRNDLFLPTLAGLCLLYAAGPAAAQSIDSCGDIHVAAKADCEVVLPSAQCEAMCTPISVEAACAAQLTAKCDGQCQASAKVECTGSCQAECKGKCEVDPGKFDCSVQCQGRCGASCDGSCSASNNKAECKASCEATCGGSCDAKCDVQAPSADCSGKCEASCSGSCTAEANLDCQVDCQANFYAECKVDVKGGCDVACKSEEGALFCEGQYVDYGNNLDECVAALKETLDANIEGYASGQGQCASGTCTADGEAGVSCSAAPYSVPNGSSTWLLALVGLAFTSRRKSRL